MKNFRTIISLVVFFIVFATKNELFAQYTRYIAPTIETVQPKSNLSITPIAIKTNSAVSSTLGIIDHIDIPITPYTSDIQSEVSLSINPNNSNILVCSFNTISAGIHSQSHYISTNAGLSWSGSDIFDQSITNTYSINVLGDPSTAFDANGNIYISSIRLGGIDNVGNVISNGYYLIKSTNNSTFGSSVFGGGNTGFDKEMIACDYLSTSPYKNYLYAAWTENDNSIKFNRSTNGGATFSSPLILKSGSGLGTNVQTGPNGEVYVCWADYGSSSTPIYPASGLGFVKSSDGGATFTNAKIGVSYKGIRKTDSGVDPNFNNIRVNDFPSMAVDKSRIRNNGRIYVVFAAQQNGNGKAVIEMASSDDKGNTWTSPKVISISNATQSFFPWVAVDQTTGNLFVAYYAIDGSNFQTNTYLAISNDGGNTFINQLVSDVPHTTLQITSGDKTGYQGDYIGVTAQAGKAYVGWMDQRSGIWQVYISEVDDLPGISGPAAFCSTATYTASNIPSGQTVTWSVAPTGMVNLSPNGNSVTVTKVARGYFTLTATISGGVTGTFNATTQPDCTAVTANMSGSCNGSYQTWYLSATPNMAASNWHWTVDNPSSANYNIYNPYAQSTYISVSGGGGGISVTYTDPCGETSHREGATIYSPCARGYAYVAYPNPASSQLSVKFNTAPTGVQAISTDNTALSVGNTNFIAEIYDGQGRLLKKSQTTNNEAELTFNTSDLANGTYYLHIKTGTDLIEKQVYIKH